jgi:multiple sugar transport system permease protein
MDRSAGWTPRLRQALLFCALAAFTLLSLVPVLWAALTSIKQPVDAFTVPPTVIFTPTFEFHHAIWVDRGFWRFLINSAVVAVSVVMVSVPIGTLAAYALSRLDTARSRALLFALLMLRMFPAMLLAVPFFMLAQALRLHDTYIALVAALIAINQPFTIWLMRSFFRDIPRELDEAARIDGCNRWQTFIKVILPLARPGLAVTALFSLLLAYNEFLLALVLTGSQVRTLPVAIAEYGAEDIAYWSMSAAGAIGIMAPIVLFMVAMQRHLVRGLTFGAVKG